MKISKALAPVVVLLFAFASAWTGCTGGGDEAKPVNDDRALAVTIQGDGRIVAAGDSYAGATYDWNLALARCNADGSPDASFGAGGKVTTNVGNDDRVADVVVQGDGKIVAAGYSYDGFHNFTLVRYNANGGLDASFGYGGKVSTAMGGGAQAVAIQGDGKIVAAGYFDNGSGGALALVRYLGNGALDNAFGSGGKSLTAGVAGGASGLAIQADGKIVAVGNTDNGGGYPNFVVARYDGGGSLDNTFGTGGKVSIFSTYRDTLNAVVLQGDGRIVAAGCSYGSGGGYDLAVRRFNGDGSPDAGFGTGGKATVVVGGYYPLGASVALVPGSDNIVVAGFSDTDLVLARYKSDGTPDATFGSGGKVRIDTGSVGAIVFDMAIQPDGRIVLAGKSYVSSEATGYDVVVLRYNANGSLDTTFGSGGRAVTAY